VPGLVRARAVRLVGSTIALRRVHTELRRMVLCRERRTCADTCDETHREDRGDKLALHYFPLVGRLSNMPARQSLFTRFDGHCRCTKKRSEEVFGRRVSTPRAHVRTSGNMWKVSVLRFRTARRSSRSQEASTSNSGLGRLRDVARGRGSHLRLRRVCSLRPFHSAHDQPAGTGRHETWYRDQRVGSTLG
jgi:hypothetical protein